MKNLFMKLRKIYKDNTGSAIVMVVIAMAFISILGVTIMWMSLSNFRMKVTDEKNKQGFYTAETVFEQIKVGLQSDVSRAANTAYSYVMQNYSDWTNEAKREAEYKREFKRSLIKIITEDPSGATTKYSVDHLKKFVDGNLNISSDPTDHGNPIRYIGAISSGDTEPDEEGDIEGIGAGVSGDETSYIVLKDLVLEYTDNDGFYSEIHTDIMISAPSTSFLMGRSELPKAFDYALIADQGIEAWDPLAVNGGVYAGSDGIRVGSSFTVNKATTDDKSESNVISKGPLALEKNSSTTINNNYNILQDESVFYASDITVDQADLDIYSDTRVANDLSITGNGSGYEVKLAGRYTGFGHEQNTDRNDESSAIIINGLNTNVDLTGLRKLILAGRAFVGTKNAKKQAEDNSEVVPVEPVDVSGNKVFDYGNNNDVKMGESIAAKGNQLAYLVPSECIAVGSKSLKGKNPLTWDEYVALQTEYASNNTIKIVDIDTRISWLENFPLKYFLEGSTYQDATMTVYVPSNGEILLYFYVKLDDSKKMDAPYNTNVDRASQYAQWYYEAHKDKMDRYMQAYAPSVKLPTGVNTVYSAATLISSDGTLKEHTVSNALRSTETSACNEYSNTYDAYVISTSENKVFESKINETNLDTFLTDPNITGAGSNPTFTIPAGESHEGLKAIVANATTNETFTYYDYATSQFKVDSKDVYKFDDDTGKVRVLISKKDILLTKPFTGLIITKGKVFTSGSGITVTGLGKGTAASADLKDEISSVLSTQFNTSIPYDASDPQSWRPIELFVDGYVGVGDDGSVSDDTDIYSSVNFSNWVKR